MMFSIQCLAEEKKLAKALVALNGLVLDLKVLPVTNAKPKNGKVVETGEGHTAYDTIVGYINKHKPTELSSVVLNDIVAKMGYTQASWRDPVKRLIKERILKKTTKYVKGSQQPMIYKVL